MEGEGPKEEQECVISIGAAANTHSIANAAEGQLQSSQWQGSPHQGWAEGSTHHGQVLQAPELHAIVVLAVSQEAHQAQDAHHDNEDRDHGDYQGISPRFTSQIGQLCKETKGMRSKKSLQGLGEPSRAGTALTLLVLLSTTKRHFEVVPALCYVLREQVQNNYRIYWAGKDHGDYQFKL